MFKSIVFMIFVINFIYADINTNWCTPATESSGDPYPELSDKFQTTVESNFRSATDNFTSEYDEYYDFEGNRGLLVKSILTENVRQYFLYDTDEMITIFSKSCFVSVLSQSAQSTPFGYVVMNKTGHIFSPINSLKLNYTHQYIGENTIRGVNVKQWLSCAYLDELKSTVKITWSFSNPSNWNSTIHFGNISQSVPVEMNLEGITDDGITWNQVYNYIKFRPYLEEDREIFETPVGIYCPGRKATKPLPKIPNHFSFRIEGTSIDLNITTTQAEWYDDENKLVRLDSQPITDKDIALFGKTSITEIHDFKRGLRFVIDKKAERCINYTVLDPQGVDSDYSNNTNYVRLRTALELFNFDKNSTSYQYHGTRKVRNIDCDVWIAIRDDWPPHPELKRTSTWEWYFMSANWTSYNYGIEEYNIPVKLIITNYNAQGEGFISTTIVYNYFDYNQEKPEIFSYDLESCYPDLATRHLYFSLDLVYTKYADNRKAFKYAVANAISKVAYVVPTRITSLELEATKTETFIIFKLLDKSPIKGNVENPVEDISLDDAYSLLEKAINKGDLTISYNGTDFKAKAKSLQPISMKYKTGFSTWYLVICGAGGAVVGVALTAIIIAIARRKKTNDTVLTMSSLKNPHFN